MNREEVKEKYGVDVEDPEWHVVQYWEAGPFLCVVTWLKTGHGLSKVKKRFHGNFLGHEKNSSSTRIWRFAPLDRLDLWPESQKEKESENAEV